jgi:hypothetical protein
MFRSIYREKKRDREKCAAQARTRLFNGNARHGALEVRPPHVVPPLPHGKVQIEGAGRRDRGPASRAEGVGIRVEGLGSTRV